MNVLWLTNSAMIMEPYTESLKDFCPTSKIWLYDETNEVDKTILNVVETLKPDFIIYTGHAEGPSKPKTETLLELKKMAKTAFEASDASCPGFRNTILEYQEKEVFDLIFNVDGNDDWPKRNKDFTTVALVGPTYFNDYLTKDIRLGFAGGDGSFFRRQVLVPLDVQCGLKVHPRNEKWGSYQDCANFLMRCQMTVNFPQTASGNTFHLKARVLEAGLACCCLFEQKNPITPKYFMPGVDYIEYEDVHDLIDKIKNTSDLEIIDKASHLYSKVIENYLPHKTWQRVFAALQ